MVISTAEPTEMLYTVLAHWFSGPHTQEQDFHLLSTSEFLLMHNVGMSVNKGIQFS